MKPFFTPFDVTVEHQTKEDGTVTIRYRNTMTQERIHMKSPRAAAHPSTIDHWGFHMTNKISRL